MTPLVSALSLLDAVLWRMRIRYLLGGSIASAVRGVLRATIDVDLLVEIIHIPTGQLGVSELLTGALKAAEGEQAPG